MIEVTRAHLPNPLESTIEQWDLHIGCVCRPEQPEKRFIAVMLQPSDALLIEHKVGTVVPNWPDLMKVVNGLMESGREAWGPPPRSMQLEEVALRLGQFTGALIDGPTRDRLVKSLKDGDLRSEYIVLLRDILTSVLRDSGSSA